MSHRKREIETDLLPDIPSAEESRLLNPIEARKKAMDYLARREHGRVELVRKLEQAGFEQVAITPAIEGLIEDGLQSDARFAEAMVSSRINQGKGPLKIRADLKGKGIDESLIDAALAEVEHDWVAAAREVRARKFGLEEPIDYAAKARQMRFLQSRGFDSEQIRSAVSAFDD
ncbi:MAG: regulatory protein RecX [Pseudomonadota bacterium]